MSIGGLLWVCLLVLKAILAARDVGVHIPDYLRLLENFSLAKLVAIRFPL